MVTLKRVPDYSGFLILMSLYMKGVYMQFSTPLMCVVWVGEAYWDWKALAASWTRRKKELQSLLTCKINVCWLGFHSCNPPVVDGRALTLAMHFGRGHTRSFNDVVSRANLPRNFLQPQAWTLESSKGTWRLMSLNEFNEVLVAFGTIKRSRKPYRVPSYATLQNFYLLLFTSDGFDDDWLWYSAKKMRAAR